jgi:hypothetical protein
VDPANMTTIPEDCHQLTDSIIPDPRPLPWGSFQAQYDRAEQTWETELMAQCANWMIKDTPSHEMPSKIEHFVRRWINRRQLDMERNKTDNGIIQALLNEKIAFEEELKTELKTKRLEIENLYRVLDVRRDEATQNPSHDDEPIDHRSDLEQDNRDQQIQRLLRDNDILREQIVQGAASKGNVVLEEENYVQTLGDLAYNVETWVKREVRRQKIFKEGNTEWHRTYVSEVLSSIQKLGVHGEAAAKHLSSFPKQVAERKMRMIVVRHIVALYVFSEVFETFTFGLDRDESTLLQDMVDNVWSHAGKSVADETKDRR